MESPCSGVQDDISLDALRAYGPYKIPSGPINLCAKMRET